MRRIRRISLYAAAGLAGLAVLLAVPALVVIQTPWFHQKVHDRIVYELEKATGGRVEMGAFDFDWRRMEARVSGLTIHGREAAGEEPLLRAETIGVGLRVVSVWKKKVDIASLAVEKPRVHLIVYEDGSTNVPAPQVRSRRGAVDTVLDLAVQRFRLSDGVLATEERKLRFNVLGENLRTEVRYEPSPARYLGELSCAALDMRGPGGAGARPAVSAGFVVSRKRFEVTHARFAMGQSAIEAHGAIADLSAPRAEFEYSGRVELKDVPAPYRTAAVADRGWVKLSGRGSLAGAKDYWVDGRVEARGILFAQHGFRVRDIGIASGLAVTPQGLELRGLMVSALGGRFTGRAELARFEDLRVTGKAAEFAIERLEQFGNVRPAVWNGSVSGPVELTARLRDAKLEDIAASGQFEVQPSAGPNPVEGAVAASYDGRTGEVAFGSSSLVTRSTRVEFSGTPGGTVNVKFQSSDLNEVLPAFAMLRDGPAPALPLTLKGGTARFEGTVSGPLADPTIRGHAAATNFIVEGRAFDSAAADVAITQSKAVVRNASLAGRRMQAAGSVTLALREWQPAQDQPVYGSFTARAANAADLAAEAGVKLPFAVSSGEVSANIELAGTLASPRAFARVRAAGVKAAAQPFDRVQADVRYSGETVEVLSSRLEAGPNRVEISGSFEHPKDNWREGHVRFQAVTPGFSLSRIEAVKRQGGGLGGLLETRIEGEFELTPSGFQPVTLDGTAAVRNLTASGDSLGTLELAVSTKGSSVDMRIGGKMAGSTIAGQGRIALEAKYPVRGHIEFTPVDLQAVLARLGLKGADRLKVEGSVVGQLDFSGSTEDLKSFAGELRLPAVEVRPAAGAIELAQDADLTLRNTKPVVIAINSREARIRDAYFHAKETDLKMTGSVTFGLRNPWDLRVQGDVNLALLQDFQKGLTSSGGVSLDVSIRGSLARPDFFGQIDLKNASLNLADFPNGIDRANGRMFVYRDRLTVENVTAESGGGKLAITGFAGFSGVTNFHLQAKAQEVRVRYPEGVSSTMDATLSLTGTLERSLLSGNITLTRVGLNPRSDLASILAKSAQPVRTAARANKFEQGVRFDVRIVTAPQVRLETALTRDVQAEADLRLRGDPIRPVLLGRVSINQGEVLFFGTRYTINSGQILLVNAAKIEPIVNLDLETRVRGIDVTLHVAGPADKLTSTPSSDPPMSLSDIVALLATGREPANSAGGLAGSQNQVMQSWQQAGASALVQQAIASPITGRLQRFFGVSNLKIDPQVIGATNNATARMTLDQQITSKLGFTYITDLSRAQAQSVRIEWDLNKVWSAVALREENGLFGIDFLYKKQFK
jgi:translocation and assembly module TamB